MGFKVAVGYARTSSETNPKTSIPNQINMIKEYCKTQNIYLREIYIDECKSGKMVDGRDQYQEMLYILEKENIGYVIVSNFDRFGRDAVEFTRTVIALKNKGIGVISVSQASNSLEMSPVQIVMSGVQGEMENQYRTDRLKSARDIVRKEGKFAKPHVPFGYKMDENRHLEIDPEEAIIVKRLFGAFVEVKNYSQAIAQVNKEFPFIDLKYSKAQKILSRSLYTGTDSRIIIEENGEPRLELISNQTFTPIITEDLFYKSFNFSQEIAKTTKDRRQQGVLPNYVVSQLIRCINCKDFLHGKRGVYICSCQGQQYSVEEIGKMWLECFDSMERQNKQSTKYEGKKKKLLMEIEKNNLRFATCKINKATFEQNVKQILHQITLLEQEDKDVNDFVTKNLRTLFKEGKKAELSNFVNKTQLEFQLDPKQLKVIEINKALP